MTRHSLAIAVCTIVCGAGLRAQLPSGNPPPQTNATTLPLSGRAGAGSVTATQTPVPGVTSSVNTLSTTIQVQGPYQGSSASEAATGPLKLRDAIRRGLEYNLGTVGVTAAVRQAAGQARTARSGLLPNLNGSLRETVQQTNLAALGVRLPFAPTVVGPFNYFDLRATLTQTVADLTTLNNYRAVKESKQAAERAAEDAKDLVVLAVGGAYLQAVAARARVTSARAQLETAKATLDQTVQRKNVGLVPQLDVNRSRVELQSREQRLSTLENDLAKQKINVARLVGLRPTDAYELADEVSFSPAPSLTLEQALQQAYEHRADLKAAQAQIRAAERARAAARAERYPSLAVSADYGAIGINPAQSHGTFNVTGSLRFPIWQGGRVEGDVEQAEAAFDQRQAELQDLRSRIEADVRSAYLDLSAAARQVELSANNREVASDTLRLTRQRYEAGITDIVEVLQAQESVSNSDLDYITAVFAHNVAKLSLARALGRAEESYAAFLNLQ